MKAASLLLASLACLTIPSCKEKTEPTTRPASTKSEAAIPEAEISDEDLASAIEFAHQFEVAVASGNEDFIKGVFDFERIIEHSFSDIELPDEFRKGMRTGMQTGRDNATQSILNSKVDFVEYRSVKGKPGILFRFRVEGGMDYVEYQITKSGKEDPAWVISDAYTHSMGSFVSDLLRAMILPALAEFDRSLVAKVLSGNPKGKYMENVPKISQMMQLARQGDKASGEQALELWKTIPDEVKKDKFAMVAHILAQSCLLEDIESAGPYLEAINDLEKAYPGDPAMALMAIDQNIIRKDYDGAREAIQTLKKSIPGSYLDFYMGYVDLHEEKYDDCETIARAFIELEPQDSEGYELLLEAGFGGDKHEVTAEALTKLEADFNMDYSGALTAEGFENFNQSEAGKAWAAAREEN